MTQKGGHTFNIQTAGAVQTGDGAVAHVQQDIGGDDLARLLQQFIAELQRLPADSLPHRDIVVMAAEACEADAKAGKADVGKIGTVLSGVVKGGVELVKDAPKLIEGVSAIANMLNIAL